MRTLPLLAALALPLCLSACDGATAAPPVADAAPDTALDTALDSPADTALDVTDEALADLVTPADRAVADASDVGARLDAADAADARDVSDVTDVTDARDVSDVADARDASDAPPAVGPYPAGPYGNREGDVLANLAWEGYQNLEGRAVSTTLPYGPVTLQSIRETGRHYALVHISEFY
jgi:hypothetical protein